MLDLAIPLVQKDLIPYATYLGLVEFGTETFFASDNVTFTARDFAMSLNTTPDTPTLDIPTPEVPGTGSCLDFGILRRLDVLVMIGLGYLFFHM